MPDNSIYDRPSIIIALKHETASPFQIKEFQLTKISVEHKYNTSINVSLNLNIWIFETGERENNKNFIICEQGGKDFSNIISYSDNHCIILIPQLMSVL